MTAKLSFGYLYDFRNPPQWCRPSSELYSDVLDVIAATEGLGFGGAWLPEHHVADDSYLPAPLLMLAAVATRTRTMRIGTAVGLAPLYNPVRFAEDCAVLDILSNGRLDLGLGIGYRRRETAAVGVDFSKRGARFDEFLEIVTRLWSGETVSFDGKHFQIQGAKTMPPAPSGRVPLYIGGFAEKAIERVLRHGEGYVGPAQACRLYMKMLTAAGRDTASAKVRVLGLTTIVAHDPDRAMEELAPYFHHINNSYAAWAREDNALGTRGMTPMSLEEYKASGDLRILAPEAAISMFRKMQQQMPFDHYVMSMPGGLPPERFMHYAEVFASEVLPAFR